MIAKSVKKLDTLVWKYGQVYNEGRSVASCGAPG